MGHLGTAYSAEKIKTDKKTGLRDLADRGEQRLAYCDSYSA